MTNSKHTKKALLMSVLSLLLCLSMLIGSTFAWFTDSVTSGNNKIVAGNLDVDLQSKQKDGSYKSVEAADVEKLFNIELWEPGVVAVETFKVVNLGTLALKYQLSLATENANFVVEAGETEPTARTLADVLKVAVVANGEYKTREDAINAVKSEGVALKDYISASTVIEAKLLPAGKTADGFSSGEDTFTVVLYWEPSAVDNDYNLKNGAHASDAEDGEVGALSINFAVNLFATQVEYERDSFDDQYDSQAWSTFFPTKVGTMEDLQAAVEEGGNIQLTDTFTHAPEKAPNLYADPGTPAIEVAKDSEVNIDFDGNALIIDSPYGKDGIKGNSGATLTLSDGAIEANKGYGSSYPIVHANKGTVILDGMTVTLEAKDGVTVSAGTDGGVLIIKNSTINGPDTKYSNAVFVGSKAEAEITDSTINGSINVGTNGKVVIENSTVKGTIYVQDNKTVTIVSGKFTIKPDTKWLAAGSTLADAVDGDGYWVVTSTN